MTYKPYIRRGLAAGTIIGSLAGTAVVGDGSAFAAPPTIAQSITVPCPTPVQVTPALNTNLISNSGAESTTPYPASYNLPKASANESEPDCWTISGQSTNPGGIVSALAYVPATGAGQSTKPANPTTGDANKGTNLFYGGISSGPTIRDINIWSYATQSISLHGLQAPGQNFSLSGFLGGLTTQADFTDVSVLFENASGKPIEPGIPFQIGPVTPAQRSSQTSLVFRRFDGVVPAGAATAVVTIAMEQSGAGPADNDAMADSLNLTIGNSVAGPTPTLITEPYSFPRGSGGGLVNPQGISAAGGNVYVSNTVNNNVSDLNPLSDQATGDFTPIIAGSLESFGEKGDGGQAVNASLFKPGGTAEDSSGNVYIADTQDAVVREVNVKTGVITLVAGTGDQGSSGLNGKATKAELSFPEAVAVDQAGDVFIADTGNNRVVEVKPGGKMVPFAGTGKRGHSGDGKKATSAKLNRPTDVAVDAKGNLYIADAGNNIIRRVDAKTSKISTVAGNFASNHASDGVGGFSGDGLDATSARLHDPEGIALDGAGDLFIADRFNNAIRMVTPKGTITTVVNTSSGGAVPASGAEVSGAPSGSRLNGPVAVDVDTDTNTLYIADTSNNSVAAVLFLAKGGEHAGPQ